MVVVLQKLIEKKTKDTTTNKTESSGSHLLQQWNNKSNDKIHDGKLPKFIKSLRTNSPTENTETSLIPANGDSVDSFMYNETSSIKFGSNVFVSFERTKNIQNSNISFYYNRYSNPTRNLG